MDTNVYSEIRKAANDYVDLSLPIITLCSHNHAGMNAMHLSRCKSPGKSPIVKKWSERTGTTREDLDKWFSYCSNANIGLVLGDTGTWNIIGVDIDGSYGEKLWKTFCAKRQVPTTWEFSTGNGRRLLFLLPLGVKTQKHKVNWKAGHEELAFIASGQQTVVPPSIHPSGRKYKWIEDRSPVDMDCAEAPSWLAEKVYERNVVTTMDGDEVEVSSKQINISTPVVAEEYSKTTEHGNRSDTMARFVGSLCAKRNIPQETVLATAIAQNKKYCNPPLDIGEITAMVESIWTAEMTKHQKILERQRKRQELTSTVLAEMFLTKQATLGRFWRYNTDRESLYTTMLENPPWQLSSQDMVEVEINEFLNAIDPGLNMPARRAEIQRQVELYLQKNDHRGHLLDLGKHPYREEIALQNGVLRWSTEELSLWGPEFNHTSLIEAPWLPNEPETKEAAKIWEEALSNWLPEEETRSFLQEYIGYALLPSNKMRTAVFLYGDGSNGKSLFMDIVQLLFESSCTTTSPVALASRFGSVQILDKLLVLCSDIDATYLDSTGTLKQIIAGDSIRAEYKGGAQFAFVPTCKLLFSANRLPKSADRSHGWYSRLKLVHFDQRFEPNPKYYNKLMSTFKTNCGRSAILQWAVKGLKRLERNGTWTHSVAMDKALQIYKSDNDTVQGFAEEQLKPTPVYDKSYKTSLLLKATYFTYKEWCSEVGVKAVSQTEFTARISVLYPKESVKWKTRKGWRAQIALVGVQFIEEATFDGRSTYDLNASLVIGR